MRFVAGGRAPKGALVLGRVQSEPLWRIVRFMDRHSDNFTAEMVAKAIGAYAGGSGTTARGMHVAGEVAAPMLGEDAALVHLADGSGLSHANRTTASALARLLAAAAANPAIAKPLAGALSVAGANGTLAHRLPALRGRVLGKSGTLDNVSALAGYVTAGSGRRFAFAVLMNVPALSDWNAHGDAGRDRHAARQALRRELIDGLRAVLEQALEGLVVEHRHAEVDRLRELRARARAGHDVARALGDRVGDLAAALDHARLGLVARERRERAGDHEREARPAAPRRAAGRRPRPRA